ncbi:alpha/beta fold hydrolase [Rhodococcus sp. 5A-K4]|uniref:alpha/beta fold hydrolase n=1 Tax=Rhodococcus TaxID=1827 RepID=UPI00355C6069
MPQLNTPSGSIGYTDTGQGPVIMFVHGFLFDKSMWTPQVRYFTDHGYRTVCVDLLGFGESTALSDTTPVEAHTVGLLAVLDALQVAQVTLVGYSMGGQVALDFADAHPGRINALILSDTFAHLDTDAVISSRFALADRLEREGTDAYSEEFLPHVLSPRTVRELPGVANHARRMMVNAHPAGAAAALRGRAQRRDYTATATALAVPALVIAGSEDSFDRGVLAADLAASICEAQLHIVAHAGHTPSMEQPGAFNQALHQFLDSTVAAGITST